MPIVSFTHTEINPSHSQSSGGGRRIFAETELTPIHTEGIGGGRRVFIPGEIPPILGLPLPEVSTGPATDIGLTEATINGFLEDDGGLLCDCAFEWGLTESYGNITSIKVKVAEQYFSQVLSRLELDTLYHFRAIASNVFGLTYGGNRVFRTSRTLPPPYFQDPLMLLLKDET